MTSYEHAPAWLGHSTRTVASESMQLAAGAAFIALLSQIRIVLPWTPVPITGQTLAVVMIPAVLGALRGTLTVVLYLAAGISGLPVFSGWNAGWQHLLGPTGGYLVGFLLAAMVVGKARDLGVLRSWRLRLLVFLVANLIIYLFGYAWLIRFVGPARAVALGVLPFLAGDLLKCLLAAAALRLSPATPTYRSA